MSRTDVRAQECQDSPAGFQLIRKLRQASPVGFLLLRGGASAELVEDVVRALRGIYGHHSGPLQEVGIDAGP